MKADKVNMTQTYRISVEGTFEGGKRIDYEKIYVRNFVPRVGESIVIQDPLNHEHTLTVKAVIHNFCCPLDKADPEITVKVVAG